MLDNQHHDPPEPDRDNAPAGSTDIIPRSTIESIVALRNVALEKFGGAYVALTDANKAIQEAHAASAAAAPNQINSYTFQSDRARKDFLCKLEIASEENFLSAARRLTDIAVWSYIIEMTELESVMDKEEKDKLRTELNEDPPEVTVDNIHATLERFVQEADTIWRRGVANCFSKLDRRFRSHTGWKIGSRVILDRAFDDWGHWNFHRNHQDTLIDIERAFYILDGSRVPEHWYGITSAIDQARRSDGHSLSPRQTEVSSEFFTVRIYKNGNCHIWFRRDDLVEKVNKTLAEYYGEVLADGTDDGGDGDLFTPKTTLAKNFGHFPTPPAAADELVSAAALYRREDEPPLTVLEPSAGAGNLARRAAETGAVVDCVEVQAHLAKQLEASGLYRRVWQGDFIARPPAERYDRVIMNPPFDMERDIDHVVHALRFVKPDGLLVAIMSAGTEWRETRKARAFRDRMAALNARWRDLPAGSFSEVGTNVNTVVLRVFKDGRSQPYGW